MNLTTSRLPRSFRKISRRGFLSSVSAFLISARYLFLRPLQFWANVLHTKSSQAPSLSQGVLDLHEILKDEIRANFKDNVYAALGNKLQLDGEAYVQVSRALATHDFLDIIRSTPLPEQDRQRLMHEQIAKTETAYLSAVESLDWPKYSVDLGTQEIRVSGPLNLNLYAQMNQPVIFVLRSSSPSPETVRIASPEIRIPITELIVAPRSSRYLLGSISPPEKGDREIKVGFTTDQGSRELVVAAKVGETVLLEGLLVTDEPEAEPPIARIRVTDVQGRYFPPEAQPSGLIRMPLMPNATKAERWAYAEGEFKVRVPLGRIRVSIRRGLEYRSCDEEIETHSGGTLQKKFVLSRWAQMEKESWYPGDMHVHMLDPKTALFESRAECLNAVNVMVFKHLENTYAREHFTGGLDPASDARHFIYYNEEFRNEPLGHVGLVNLKKLVEPIATGRLGFHWPTIMRYGSLNMPLPFHGDANSPDFPLLLQAMRKTHQQGGLVDWAHLRSSQWEFPLDAEEGQIDLADIMTHTEIPQDLALWYALLNCGFHIPACAGTDRIEPTDPIGHQRVYVWLDAPLSYESWMKGLKAGSSFVTNGPMLQLRVNGIKPGGEIRLSAPREVSISASAFSQIPFERLEIIVNGEIIRTAGAREKGASAEIAFELPIKESSWIAARCLGAWNKELFYSHPVFAHTNPVHIRYREERVEKGESARYLLGFLRKLEHWAAQEAYFENPQEKEEVLRTIRTSIGYFERISQRAEST